MRIKSRFIIAQVLPSGSVSSSESQKLQLRDFHQALREKIQELFGDVGSGEIGGSTMVKFLDAQYTGLLVIRCPREHEVNVRFALSALTKVKSTIDVAIRTLRVKGSARTCIEAVQQLASTYICATIANEENQMQLLDSLHQTISAMDL